MVVGPLEGTHVCNPIGRITVQSRPRQKVRKSKTLSGKQPKSKKELEVWLKG
jgi:hypothetical protein